MMLYISGTKKDIRSTSERFLCSLFVIPKRIHTRGLGFLANTCVHFVAPDDKKCHFNEEHQNTTYYTSNDTLNVGLARPSIALFS
mmetsp:Transcript_57954/g.172955  ORF Transcript_57954/g.172955 Transcript_57954/m.172955 type:complete len:85 (+) Transcript_57954:39-293(+)